jgi:transcriptional regulator with XRE-family HTH domain
MRKRKTYLTGQELADILPKIYAMRQQGDTLRYIGNKYGISEQTMSRYLIEYKSYLSGGEVRQIARAIPYFVVQQAKMKFTEEKGRQPEQHSTTNQEMRKRKTYLTGQELAEVLPKVHTMQKRGMTTKEIAQTYNLSEGTIDDYIRDYKSYLRGGKVRQIARAIPYLIIQQAKVKFTEEKGRQPEQRGSYTKPKQQEVKRTQLSVLWGLLKINW